MEAVTGRKVLLHHELLCMIAAENILTAYRSNQGAANWAAWAGSNPRLADVLQDAIEAYENG